MNHWCDTCKNSVKIVVLEPTTIGHPDDYTHVEFKGEEHGYEQEYPVEDAVGWKLGQTFCWLDVLFSLRPVRCQNMDPETIPGECPRILEFMVLTD